MQTIFNSETTADRPARSSPPWVWFGFIFAFAFFVVEVLEIVMELDSKAVQPLFVLIVLAGWLYWLSCVHRFHKILAEMTDNRYPIAPSEAVGKHFIPFYNLYWLFAWPSQFSTHLNNSKHVRVVPGAVLGLLLLLSLLLRFFDGAFGLALTFAVGLYISAKLRSHMRSIQGVPADMLPPPPPEPGSFPAPTTS